jgi:NAD(P)H dehydrogenase (quinone)
MILVTGASGKTGRAVISSLVSRGCSVRALVHRESQVPSVESLGADEVIIGDMRSQPSLSDAARGVDSIYHICPNVSPDEISIGKMTLSAAQAAGVRLFVFHSVLHPQIEAMPHHWQKLRVEEALFESRLHYTVLQPAAYMQSVLAEWQAIVERGVYAVPYSLNAPMSLVDLEDVGQAAATVLTEPGHVGGIYELAGPEVLTPNQVAEIIGHRLGGNVHAEQTSIDSWRQRAEASGLGAYQVDTLVKMFNYYDHYGLWGNSRILEELIGRPATRFQDFLERTIRSRSAST